MNTSRGFISLGLILLLVIGLALIGGGGWWAVNSGGTVGTADAVKAMAQYSTPDSRATFSVPSTWHEVDHMNGSIPEGITVASPDLQREGGKIGEVITGAAVSVEIALPDLSAATGDKVIAEALAFGHKDNRRIGDPRQVTLGGEPAVYTAFKLIGEQAIVRSMTTYHRSRIYTLSLVSASSIASTDETEVLWKEIVQSFEFVP